jgi:hypothetical protein
MQPDAYTRQGHVPCLAGLYIRHTELLGRGSADAKVRLAHVVNGAFTRGQGRPKPVETRRVREGTSPP